MPVSLFKYPSRFSINPMLVEKKWKLMVLQKKNKTTVILCLVGRSYCLAVSESLCMFCLDSNEKTLDIDANLI